MKNKIQKMLMVLCVIMMTQSIPIQAQEQDHSPGLEAMKKLAGTWTGDTYKHRDDRVWGESEAVVTYAITGRGSAVVETLFPDTPLQMTTVYHDDPEGNLVMTHYCTAWNQPKLALVSFADNKLHFSLAPDSDIDAGHEHHAHELVISLGEDGSLMHDWTNHNMGEPADLRNIKLVRLAD